MSFDFDYNRSDHLYRLNERGEPVKEPSIQKWAEWFGAMDNRQVALTQVGEYEVSTVFLGMDHAFGGGPPILWETMVFGTGTLDRLTSRCAGAREQAEAMHEMVVEEVREKMAKEAKP